ncbi:metallophosphoesterase [Fervidibacillus halotolerans]|uniref:Metallophosphoesterase n=1 Tax=Fervidibacillus halotolerans TaxID=2980027 RepID=A0A9E8M155_9BACI|nr:metallophosphoesterase [Fervidibacillus halotolerans]WAA13324.1 metallophosphoesterase [Fervidibacillus halotolerans]
MHFVIFGIIAIFTIRGVRIGYLKNTKRLSVQKVKVPIKSNDFKLSVLQLSDLHLEKCSISPEQLHTMINNESFDLIALTGDFLDKKRTIPKLIPYLEVLQGINARYGIYVVFGNHDYVLKRNHFHDMKDLFHQYGCITLQNESISIRKGSQTFNIIGIDDYSTRRSNLEKSFEKVSPGYRLVLTHDPNIILDMDPYPYDYLLSGHFHGGQIYWPKPYHLRKMGKLPRKNVIKGLHFQEGKPFYISEGLGQTAVNIRFGSFPEITFHEIG